MRVNLLSEVAAYADGTDTDLLADLRPMNRLFVAVLALTPGRPAGMDRLTEQIWGEDPVPDDPRARLHSYAAKTRACLKNTRDLLVTQASGYCLRIDGGSVDVHRFRETAAQARASTVADDDVATLTRAALREWGPGPVRLSGPQPLSGLPGQWAMDYRVALRREHRDAVINLLRMELRRGGAGRVLTQFAELADADLEAREDEEFIALLMHAYYLCGRQAEAFKAYQSTIELLRNHGVKPGRDLQTMERKIRNQDADLDYPRAGEVVPVAHDLSRADNTDQYGGGNNADADAEAQEPGDRGSAPASGIDRGPTYSQRNIGRTVIANQGTQHVNVGGADERLHAEQPR